MVNKSFYCFPKNQIPMLLYSSGKYLNHRLSISLMSSIAGKNSIQFRLRKNPLIDTFIKPFLSMEFTVPSDDVEIILIKPTKEICFHFPYDNPVKLTHLKSGQIIRVDPFKGYPILYNYSLNEMKFSMLEKVLNEHWINLKEKNVLLHNDFTHFNILVAKDKYSIIDRKPDSSNSLIYDHFYFYTYFNTTIKKDRGISKSQKAELNQHLEHVYKKNFQNEEKQNLKKYIKEITFVNPSGFSKDEFEFYKKKFSDFLENY